MGRFVLDGVAGALIYFRGRSEKGRWTLSQVTFTRRWDPVHRGFGFRYWLLATVPDGRGLRLAMGRADEMGYLLGLLSSWGLRSGR